MKRLKHVSPERILEAVEHEHDTGFCVGCGAEAYNVEPDARRYPCESCGATKVYGAQELLMMGYAGGC